MGVNVAALVTTTPVLVLKDSKGKNCENGKLKLNEKCVISESVRIKCLQYYDTF